MRPKRKSIAGHSIAALGFISHSNSSTVFATARTRSVLSMPAMLAPLTTALISSRKSVRKHKGSRCSLVTRDQSLDQHLARDQLAVQLVHALLRRCGAEMDDAEIHGNRNGYEAT
ncbi:hypothetical protein I6F33_05755 [Bradyrhizobium sp. BRP20]|nr:hypothetical protein [Bradyrhizobium sp. BRP23]MCA1432480.1 hypothetical protein [Bradyrhizobium sp. BRP20]MCA1466509.1 hypothetical protein [Bradyrhizobium sp. IC3195]MCA1497938.1 hypothetical protein [Bradyrhizobium sp. NBAIM14]MCA1524220.1 hypothetical protein [Bradyrhizobium yuanmingense]